MIRQLLVVLRSMAQSYRWPIDVPTNADGDAILREMRGWDLPSAWTPRATVSERREALRRAGLGVKPESSSS
jgi:hypothetical protein